VRRGNYDIEIVLGKIGFNSRKWMKYVKIYVVMGCGTEPKVLC
jgi:hypothetical protein